MNQLSNTIQTLNQWGEAFFTYALAMFIQSSILILILLAVDLIIRKRVRAVVRYGLWMLVLVKLILPPGLASPVSLGSLWGEQKIAKVAAAEVASPVTSEAMAFEPAFEVETAPVMYAAGPVAAPVSPSPPALSLHGWMLAGWMLGVLLLVGYLLKRAVYVRRLVAGAEEPSPELVAVLDECCVRMGVRCRRHPSECGSSTAAFFPDGRSRTRRHFECRTPKEASPRPKREDGSIRLRIVDQPMSPAVCGLFRPTILLPAHLAEKLDRDQLCAVLLHELAHVKRGDLVVNAVQTVLQVMHFFNPLLWWANAAIRRVREQAVDETVLVSLGGEAGGYGPALVRIAEVGLSRPTLSLGLVGVAESKKTLADRVRHISEAGLPRTAKMGFRCWAVLFAAGAVVLPMAQAEGPTSTRLSDETEATDRLSTIAMISQGNASSAASLGSGVIAVSQTTTVFGVSDGEDEVGSAQHTTEFSGDRFHCETQKSGHSNRFVFDGEKVFRSWSMGNLIHIDDESAVQKFVQFTTYPPTLNGYEVDGVKLSNWLDRYGDQVEITDDEGLLKMSLTYPESETDLQTEVWVDPSKGYLITQIKNQEQRASVNFEYELSHNDEYGFWFVSGARLRVYSLKDGDVIPTVESTFSVRSFRARVPIDDSRFTLMGSLYPSTKYAEDYRASPPLHYDIIKALDDDGREALVLTPRAESYADSQEEPPRYDIELSVTVVDTHGIPVSGAEMSTYATAYSTQGGAWKFFEPERVVSDTNGKAAMIIDSIWFQRLKRGPTIYARHSASGRVGMRLLTAQDEGRPVSITMYPECRVFGRLDYADTDHPAPDGDGPAVLLGFPGKEPPLICKTDYSSYEFLVPPGTYTIQFAGGDYEVERREITVQPSDVRVEVETVTLRPKKLPLLRDVLPAPAELQGITERRSGEPAASSDGGHNVSGDTLTLTTTPDRLSRIEHASGQAGISLEIERPYTFEFALVEAKALEEVFSKSEVPLWNRELMDGELLQLVLSYDVAAVPLRASVPLTVGESQTVKDQETVTMQDAAGNPVGTNSWSVGSRVDITLKGVDAEGADIAVSYDLSRVVDWLEDGDRKLPVMSSSKARTTIRIPLDRWHIINGAMRQDSSGQHQDSFALIRVVSRGSADPERLPNEKKDEGATPVVDRTRRP